MKEKKQTPESFKLVGDVLPIELIEESEETKTPLGQFENIAQGNVWTTDSAG